MGAVTWAELLAHLARLRPALPANAGANEASVDAGDVPRVVVALVWVPQTPFLQGRVRSRSAVRSVHGAATHTAGYAVPMRGLGPLALL